MRKRRGLPNAYGLFDLILGGNAPKYEAGFLSKCWVPMFRNTHQLLKCLYWYSYNNTIVIYTAIPVVMRIPNSLNVTIDEVFCYAFIGFCEKFSYNICV